MGQNNNLGPDTDGADAERTKIEEVQALLKAFDLLEGTFATLATAAERSSAEGRRCILSISGLSHHQAAFFFEVTGARIRQVPRFERYNTFVSAPIDSVIRVLKGVLDGDENAFSNEWTRGQAKLVGDHSLHDGLQFAEAFRRLAGLVKRYRALTTRGA
jgi:hypothetical protein